jgi:PAS domain S-box-containing protein
MSFRLNNPEQLEHMLDATRVGYWKYDARLRQICASEGCFTMLGMTFEKDAHTLTRWLARIHEQDRLYIRKQYEEHGKTEWCWTMEIRMLNRQGQYVWILSRVCIIERDAEGLPVLFMGVNLNIQVTKDNEALRNQIQLKEGMILGLMGVSIGSVSVYDFLKNRVTYSQWRIMNRLGYPPEEYITLSSDFFKLILHPDDDIVIKRHIEKIIQSKPGEVIECVFRLRNKDGDYHWVAMRDYVTERTETGAVSQLVGSMVDVTRYKAIKQELDGNLALLDTLSYRNSHELRAPVATVLGLVRIIRHELKTDESVQELIDALETTVEKMDRVIHEFGTALTKL